MTNNFDKSKIINFGIAYTASSIFQKGLGFAIFIFLASKLSTNDYAEFGLMYSAFSIISVLTFSGITESAISLYTNYKIKNEVDKLFSSAFIVFLFLTALTFVFYTCYSVFINRLDIGTTLLILLPSVLIGYFNFKSNLVRIEDEHLKSILYSFLPIFFGNVIGVIFIFLNFNSKFYFISLGISGLFFLFYFSEIKLKSIKIDYSIVFEIAGRIYPYITIAFIGWLLGYGNTYIVNIYFPKNTVATYIFLYSISSILQLVASSMNQVWTPSFLKIYNTVSTIDLNRAYDKFTLIQGIVVGFVASAIILVLPVLLSQFNSLSQYSDNNTAMFYLSLGYVFSIQWWHCQNYFMVNNKGRLLMNITIVSGILGFLVWFLLMYKLGQNAIYLGFAIQTLLRSLIIYFVSIKHWSLNFDWKGITIGTVIIIISQIIKYGL